MNKTLMVVLAALCFVGCEAAPRPPAPKSAAPGGPQDVKAVACEAMDRAECLKARYCTLHHVKQSVYDCKPARGPCEEGLIQSDKFGCEARAGCAFVPANCYCPFPGYGQTAVPDKGAKSGGACACGGGPPAMCAASATQEAAEAFGEPTFSPVKVAGAEGVVVPAAAKVDVGMVKAAGQGITGHWTPDEGGVAALEGGLVAFLRGNPSERAQSLAVKVAGYKRQYVGFLLGERKVIYANFFCKASEDWRAQLVDVDDGGDCYFQVVFDPASSAFSDLHINGES